MPNKCSSCGILKESGLMYCMSSSTSDDLRFWAVEQLTNSNLLLAHFSCAVNHFEREEDSRASSVALIKQSRYAA